jgi:hypothetical protein
MDKLNIWSIVMSDINTFLSIVNDLFTLKEYHNVILNNMEATCRANNRLILTLKNDLNNTIKRRSANKECDNDYMINDSSYIKNMRMIEIGIKKAKLNLRENTALYAKCKMKLMYINSLINICERLNTYNYTSEFYGISQDRQAEMIALSNISLDLPVSN